MIYLQFVASSVVIVLAAMKLAQYGDAIALRTGLGGVFVGALLMAGATSLPEILTSVSSLALGEPDLAAGNLFGSNMFNMVALAILDLLARNQRVLRKAALKHALSGSLAALMIALALFFLMADLPFQIGWIGADAMVIVVAYVVAVRLIQSQAAVGRIPTHHVPAGTPSLAVGGIGFAAAALVLILATPIMVDASVDIATVTGLGATFVGTTLVALVTSLPELATTLAALRIGAPDMAIANLFGSNMFNMMALGLTDALYLDGRFLGSVDPAMLLIGAIGLVMTCMALVGNVARLERRAWLIEPDAFALLLVYIAGLWLLWSRSVMP